MKIFIVSYICLLIPFYLVAILMQESADEDKDDAEMQFGKQDILYGLATIIAIQNLYIFLSFTRQLQQLLELIGNQDKAI